MNDFPPVRGLLDFRGKAVLVTGAGRGIGPGIALRFAEAGARVVVNYRESRKGAEAVVTQSEAAGGRPPRPSAGPCRRRAPTPACSWPRRHPAGSPASTCSSTAA